MNGQQKILLFLASYLIIALHARYKKRKNGNRSKWVQWQAAYQAKFRPTRWQPFFFRQLHEHNCTATLATSLSDKMVLTKIKRALQEVGYKTQKWRLEKGKGYQLEAWYLTPTWGWLDLCSLLVKPDPSGGWSLSIWSYSTGIFPMHIPLAPLLNSLFFWVPFSDHGFNKNCVNRFFYRLSKIAAKGKEAIKFKK